MTNTFNPRRFAALLSVLAATWGGVVSRAQEAAPRERAVPSYDAASGRDLRNYPPDPRVEYHHMRLELDIRDMNTPRLEAVQTLAFSPIAYPLAELPLDAKLLEIRSVSVQEAPAAAVSFGHDGRRLRLAFDPPVPVGERRTVVITYAVNDPPLGLIWTPESPAWPGRPAQIHTQGQAEDSSYWFPCHDFPNVRLTTEIIATVPPGYTVSSNGRLVSQSGEPELRPDGGGRVLAMPTAGGRQRFHWLQDKPHPFYLVSLVVGRFDVAEVGTRRLPMPVLVPPGRARDAERTYGRTAKMVEVFEERFDEPYPWDRYAQVVVWNFAAGGMENTSAATLFDTAVLSREAAAESDLDGLISHELAHQWFGDLITCRSWEHIWLNEGFAMYAEALWEEDRHDFEGYQAQIRANFDGVIRRDRAEAPHQPAMASKEYGHPDHTFDRAADPYSKGAAVLHMLRLRLGDGVFFRALAEYVDRFKFRQVETRDFRLVLEDVSGESLERFFAQWCHRPGVPRLEVSSVWASGARELTVAVKQVQHIDGSNPAFAFDLPVWVGLKGDVTRLVVPVEGREASVSRVLGARPDWVAIDPEMTVLADVVLTHSTDWLIEQLLRGPTLDARVQAARALAGDGSATASAALWAVFVDERQHESLRTAAIGAIARGPGFEWIRDVRDARTRNPRVRAGAVRAVAEAASQAGAPPLVLESARECLAARATDESVIVRAAAIEGLGAIKDASRLDLVLAALDADSQHDRLREAALESLALMGAPEGLPGAIRLARPGVLSDTRETAVRTIGRLASHDPAAAYAALVPLLDDRERNVWMAAVTALAGLPGAPGSADLEALAARKRAREDLEHIRAAIERPGAPGPSGG